MRAYFKKIIFDLYLYVGNRQDNKMTDDEIERLLDALERVSKLYSYIPEDKQKEIIDAQLIADKDYQNINARLISKWLEQNGKVYFQQECHVPHESNAEPLTGQAREQAIQMFLTAVQNAGDNFTEAFKPKGSGTRMRENMGVQRFEVKGLEIYAKSQEEAERIYSESVAPESEADTKP